MLSQSIEMANVTWIRARLHLYNASYSSQILSRYTVSNHHASPIAQILINISTMKLSSTLLFSFFASLTAASPIDQAPDVHTAGGVTFSVIEPTSAPVSIELAPMPDILIGALFSLPPPIPSATPKHKASRTTRRFEKASLPTTTTS